jgi:flagellar basal-body rod protein FlgG
MNHSLISSMVTMGSLQQKLDILANNIANANTVGYKKKDATFEDILTNIKQQPPGFQREGRLSPMGYNQGWGARLNMIQMSLSQGTLQPTGNEADLAIEGEGIFELQSNQNAAGQQTPAILYTRDGTFQLTPDPNDPANLYLATKDGHFVNGVDGQRISFPAGYKMKVDEQGRVFAYRDSDAGTQVGQVKLVRVVRPQLLREMGTNLYALPVNAVPGEIVKDVDNNTLTEDKIAIRQGFLEQSNVNMADEMTELMMVQRAFQLSSRAITSSDQMMNLATNLRG